MLLVSEFLKQPWSADDDDKYTPFLRGICAENPILTIRSTFTVAQKSQLSQVFND